MKKILSFLMVFVLFILVGCTTAQNKLPNLKDTDKVEMTAEEKIGIYANCCSLNK